MFIVRLKSYIVRHPLIYRVARHLKRLISPKAPNTDKKSIGYTEWARLVEPNRWEELTEGAPKPLISVVVPAYNTPDKYLHPLIESLKNQTYQNWQLCISDASTDADRKEAIREATSRDDRISYVGAAGMNISDNTNKALGMVKGDYVGLLDHDDVLSQHALQEVAIAVQKHPSADVFYSDEDKLSDDGKVRQLPFFKPDWSPELLLGVNYITHFLVIKKELLDQAGGLRAEFDGAQDYDLLLRITERAKEIVHIPKILYHWRLADGSTAKTVGEKNYANTAGQKALREAAARREINAEVVEIPERPTNYRLRFMLPKDSPMVSIVIPFKDKADLLRQCTDSIFEKTTYPNYELILLSNNSVEPETDELLALLKKDKRCKVFYWNKPFNYSKINNYGVAKSSGEYVLLLNNDTKVITSDWLEELVGMASQPGIGAVGPTLYYPDKKNGIQHAGIVVGMGGMAGHVFRHHQIGDWTDFGIPAWPRNYLAVTGACLMIKKDLYQEVGGLDETFTVAGNDVALGITLSERGYRNVYWPFASLYHYESVSVGSYNNGIQLDYDHSLKYYKKYHDKGDPYFNPNLDPMNEQIGIRSIYE
jgi:GT2 family glycosyltransferase